MSSSKMSLSDPPSNSAQISSLLPVSLFVSLTGTNDRAILSFPATRSAKIAASHLDVWLTAVVVVCSLGAEIWGCPGLGFPALPCDDVAAVAASPPCRRWYPAISGAGCL